MIERFVVTINRQFGSLGRPIAKLLSENLGIEYYDRDIVDSVASETGLSVRSISDMEEKANNSFFHMKFPLGYTTTVQQDEIFQVQSQIIKSLAQKENCIIVGRCADYVLKDHACRINVYIYASYDQRMLNCVNVLHMDPQTAKKMIADVDQSRDAYHLRYAHYLPEDKNHISLSIDSGFLGVNATAESLTDIIKKKLIIGTNTIMLD